MRLYPGTVTVARNTCIVIRWVRNGENKHRVHVLRQLDADKNIIKKMNFSFATTPGSFQGSIEAEFDKQGGKSYGPPTGKRMTIFLDDLSMPEVNTWGDQPTLELARQLVETGGVCFLDKDKRGDVKEVRGVDYVAAMDLPGGQERHPQPIEEAFLHAYGRDAVSCFRRGDLWYTTTI